MQRYCKDKATVNNNNNGDIAEFNGADATDSFNFKAKRTAQTGDNEIIEVEIMVSLKYLGNFLGDLQMFLINCEINLILVWSTNYVIVSTDVSNQGATFAVTETKLYVTVVTLSTQDNAKLLQQLKSGFKKIITWNIYQNQNC